MMADQDMCSENEPTRYDEIRTRAENTTSMIWAGTYNRETGRHEFPNGIQITDDEDGADVTFYLNARQDIPWLLERIEALELEVACKDGSLAQGGRQLDAVRKLHHRGSWYSEVLDMTISGCIECGSVDDPCPTIRVLDESDD